MNEKDREALRHLRDFMVDDIMRATDEEILSEVAEDGLDLETEAASMRAALALASGRARMAVAKASVARGLPHSKAGIPVAANDIGTVRTLTMAARNGKEQSEEDIRSAAQDRAEIEAFQGGDGTPEG